MKRRIRILMWRQADRPGKIETGIRQANRRRKKGGKMKAVLSIVLAMVASFAWGQTLRQPLMKEQDIAQQPRQRTTTGTTTTPEASGTITQYTPGSNGGRKQPLKQRRRRKSAERSHNTLQGARLFSKNQTVRCAIASAIPSPTGLGAEECWMRPL